MLTLARFATPPCFKGLNYGNVSIVQLDVFADRGNRYLFLGASMRRSWHATQPDRLRAWKVQALAGNLSQMLLLHGKRCFVQDLYIQVLGT